MKRSRFGVSTRLLALFAVVAAAGLAAPASLFAGTRASDDALSLVPAEAASVAVIRFNELRSSPLASRLFNDADHVGGNGEAARFMEEANLKPRQDVDTAVVVGLVPAGSGETLVLALFEGRFDPERLSPRRGHARRHASRPPRATTSSCRKRILPPTTARAPSRSRARTS